MSKTMISLGLAAWLTMPVVVLAQDDAAAVPSEESAPADAAAPAGGDVAPEGAPAAEAAANTSADAPADAPADAAAAEAPGADAAAATETTDAASTAAEDSTAIAETADAAPADDGSGSSGETSGETAETAAVDDDEGLKFYVGAERVEATLDLSDDDLEAKYGDDKLQGGFYRARAGLRLAPGIGVEGQGGFIPDDDKASDDAKFKHFYAAYLVTTGTVLNTVEISARVGYAWIGAKNQNADESFDGVSYGLELALPLRVISESIPDIRIVGGGTVFTQDRDQRSYGWYYGLRYDFHL